MRIPVRLGARSYPIVLADSFAGLPRQLKALGLPSHGWVISHRRLLARHGAALLGPLRQAGWTIGSIAVPESERSKSLAVAQRVLGQLARTAAMRVPVLVAFGGGVVGDLTGFVASIYRRGVPYVQVPTTLLAQVDSAIGGKTGVDLPQGKNLAGAFYQPRLVWSHLGLLATLPARQRRSGLAEVIKYGVIADPALFRHLETHLASCVALRPLSLRVMVERSCRIKARVVSADERETSGVRAQLNFGHTIGHALEAATSYRRWTHGEAIAIGMCAAAALSVREGLCTSEEAERVIALIRKAGLPTRAIGVSRHAVQRALRYDKKFTRGRPRWVLMRRIGRVVVSDAVNPSRMADVLREYVR